MESNSPFSLSLYQVETELLELIELREQVLAEDYPDTASPELAAIDAKIQEYITREVRKVDGIAGYLKECETRAAVLKEEAKRLKAVADAWEARGERIRAVTLGVMQMIQAKELRGRIAELKVAKNPPSVNVRQSELVPSEYCKAEIKIPAKQWEKIVDMIPSDLLTGSNSVHYEPSVSAIKEALKAGVSVPGCELVTDKYRLEVE